jgi:hypothetical protein
VLHKEGYGNDNVAVAWAGGGISQQVINGDYLSRWFTGIYGDFTVDGSINLEDFAEMSALWVENDCITTAAMDLNGNCRIGIYELSMLVQNWLF